MAKKLAFTPLADRVLVKPDAKAGEKKLASGIILPETVEKDKLMTGTVVAVGPGKHGESGDRIAMEVAVGDEIVFKKPWDEPLKIDGEEMYVLAESEISLIKRS
ncbi:co-chaperone GroES [Candidatus Kaiserbacteria bacterium]|nr:co-chaperone GroES [Candidatus Kaiserbacteria bacterium]